MFDFFNEVAATNYSVAGFSEGEVDLLYAEILDEGRLIEDLIDNLCRIRKLKDRKITVVRKDAWNDIIWAFGLDEPSPVPFDVAAIVSYSDPDAMRSAIFKEFAGEMKFMRDEIYKKSPKAGNEISMKLEKMGFKI